MNVSRVHRETNLRSQLKGLRTDIAMAVNDSFPLVYGLTDKNVITDQLLKDILEREGREGIHRAMYFLVSWVLQQSVSTVQDFWSCLVKDYNMESYPRLQALLNRKQQKYVIKVRCEKRSVELVHREPQNKKKNGEERHGHYSQLIPKKRKEAKVKSHKIKGDASLVNPPQSGMTLVMPMAQRTVALSSCTSSSSNVPASHEARETALFKHASPSDESAKKCIGIEGQIYSSGLLEEENGTVKLNTTKTMFHHKGETNINITELHRNHDECAVCKDGGDLICCDGCPRAFHLTCLDPPLTSIPSGTWKCQWCHSNRVKKENPQPSIQIPGGEVCGACYLPGGDLTHCLQCLQCYHLHCHFTKERAFCLSCIRPSVDNTGDKAESRVSGLQMVQPAHVQNCSFLDSIIQKEEIDSIIGEQESIDGILQWAFHSYPRPLLDSQGLDGTVQPAPEKPDKSFLT